MVDVKKIDERFIDDTNKKYLSTNNIILRMSGECFQYVVAYEVARDLLQWWTQVKSEFELRAGVKTETEVKVFLTSLNKTTDCLFNAQRCKADRRQSDGRKFLQLRGYWFKGDKPDK